MIFLIIVIVFLALLCYVMWRFSEAILKPEPYSLMPEFKIIEYKDNEVSLPQPPNKKQFANTKARGEYLLIWQNGMGRLGDIVEENATTLKRKLELVEGEFPSMGEDARMDSFVFRRNPKKDHDINFEELFLEGPVAKLQSWWIKQDKTKAVLLLHGRRRGQIIETQRALPTIHALGYSTLALSYRNHSESDSSPDGFYHYAETEWQDAKVGLEFLATQGIKEVVVYGFSMGGAVTLELLKQWQKNDLGEGLPWLKAIILDAPLIDPRSVFQFGVNRMGFPLADVLTKGSLLLARWRSGIIWEKLDQRTFAAQIKLPVLLFMGTADSTIPVNIVDEFAAAVPTIDYVRLNDVEHVEAWNVNPAAYGLKVTEFLQKEFPRAND